MNQAFQRIAFSFCLIESFHTFTLKLCLDGSKLLCEGLAVELVLEALANLALFAFHNIQGHSGSLESEGLNTSYLTSNIPTLGIWIAGSLWVGHFRESLGLGDSGVGHSRETLRLGVAPSGVGHSREISRIGHSRESLGVAGRGEEVPARRRVEFTI